MHMGLLELCFITSDFITDISLQNEPHGEKIGFLHM